MVFERFYLACLSHASYLIGDPKSGLAVVVDPQRDVDQYTECAKRKKLKIAHVVLTHFHADFVSGHLELAKRCKARIHIGAAAKAGFTFTPVADGSTIELGGVRLVGLETPGHTPEAICLLVYDLARSADKPYAVLTGDTLFIGDVGRPDLMASVGVTARELASSLYDSLRKKLLTLPDETLVYPAHGAGSMCGKALSADACSTLGAQKLSNYALKPMSKAEFIKLVTADQPEAPAYFRYDAELNRKKRPTLEAALKKGLRPLSVAALQRLQKAGGLVLDTRDADAFAKGHWRGAINVGLGGKYATWAGAVLEHGTKIALICEPGAEPESALRLGRIGFDSVAGYLKGGMAALKDQPKLVARTRRWTARELSEALAKPGAPAVLDVRNPSEREVSRIDGSAFIPLGQLPRRLAEAPKGQLVVHCAGGYRSMIAASLLERAGRADVSDLEGGMAAWNELFAQA